MSTAATPVIHRAVRFYDASIGKKAVMAVTGIILFLYVIGHLAGNLQIYSSDPQMINRYAAFLHSSSFVAGLWGARVILVVAVVLHIVASVQLWLLKREARPVGYVKKADIPASYAARTMIWSGPIIAAFVIFHILQLTVGDVLPLREIGPSQPDARFNVINGFQHPAIAGFYILAMLLLSMHLYHGLWSMFQSLGINHPRWTPVYKKFAGIFALVIGAGYISIPVAVLTGLLR